MNTPAHLLLGAAAFSRPSLRYTGLAAFLGALAPDLSLYLMTGWSIVVMQVEPRVVFGELYFSDAWMQVFAIDNSFIFWGIGLAFAIWRKTPWLIAFCGAGFLHLLCDFPLHHDDARPHFWPLSDWRYSSPFSYWDRQHGAGWISPIEAALATVAAAILIYRYRSWVFGGFVALLMLAELRAAPALFSALF